MTHLRGELPEVHFSPRSCNHYTKNAQKILAEHANTYSLQKLLLSELRLGIFDFYTLFSAEKS